MWVSIVRRFLLVNDFCSFCVGHTICGNMNIQSIRKRFLGHGVGVDLLEGSPTKKQRRTGPVHGQRQPVHGQRQLTQREELKKLLGQEDDPLKAQPQSNHQTSKDSTVSFRFARM